jgi:phosphoglycerol transferase MdoB-like AlkP superfamily enzyme
VSIPLTANRNGGVRYTDYALQWLFNAVKNKPWYNNTIFVVVADHCGSSAGKTELPVLKYQIPCMIFAPALVHAQKVDKLCSQVDVAPTIMKMLNWSYPSTFYGHDILTMKPEQERAFIGTYQKLGFIRSNQLAVLSPQKKITQLSFDRFSGDMKQVPLKDDMKQDVISLYQTAEHIFVSGKNKFVGSGAMQVGK